MANESCDLATNAQRQFILAQSKTLPVRQEFRIFPNAPPIDSGKLIFSEIMERFKENNREEEQEPPTETLELDEDDISDIIYEAITDIVEWNYGKNFNCHVCALRHLNFGAYPFDDTNPNSSGNDGTMSIEAIRYASYFLKNCTGACARHYTRPEPPQPRPKADDYEEFRLLK